MRRHKGEGSTYYSTKHQRWVGAITLPNGKRRTRYAHTEKEATEWRVKTLRDAQQGRLTTESAQRLDEYLTWWLDDVKRADIRPRTYINYQAAITQICAELGTMKLRDIHPRHVVSLYAALRLRYKPSTVHLIHTVLHQALDIAVEFDAIGRNPATGKHAPQPPQPEVRTLSAEEAARLIESGSERWRALWHLLISTGIRSGEARALRWCDVRLDDGELDVRHTLVYVAGSWSFGEPKTASSRRTLYLDADLVSTLRAHRLRQLAARLKAQDWHEHDLVFCGLSGQPLHTSIPLQALRRDLKRLGLSHITTHMLRHTAATLLLSDGEYINVVQRLLGHANARTTLGVYGHTMPQMHRQAATRMGQILRNTKAHEEAN